MSGPGGQQRPPPAVFAADRWKEIESVLDELLDAGGAERAAVLDRVATTDPALRDAVEMLLKSYDQSGDFLEEPAQIRAAPLFATLSEGEIHIPEGIRIGAYRVVRQLGRGGMGAVYLAERDDGAFHKQVALKILPPAWALDENLVRRFHDERQILASLEHPAIARLMDGGVTSDGIPYFVMEYVDGQPIDRYSEEEQLGVEQRIELMSRVCDVVQYAHDNNVVHRDLKPSNIFVLPDGQVRLLDFGIAKLVDSEDTGEITQPGLRMMTVQYASPEQVFGRPISPASDVYSLGVLLYRLLSGREPHAFSGRGIGAVERAILQSPAPPSEVVTNAAQRRRLRGQMDAVVLKAMAPDPSDRYASVADLAGDLQRWLAGKPVSAAPGVIARVLVLSRSPGLRFAAAAVALTLLLGAGGWALRRQEAATTLPETMIAVLPFTPSVADTALVRLGRDLAVTLSTSLDGVGELRTISAGIALARMSEQTGGSLAAARELGAGAVVQGALVTVGTGVRAEAALVLTSNATVIARATATAATADLPALTDSLAWSLLRQVWRTGTPPTPSLEAITTSSIPSLRAFLDGEALLLQNRYPEAIQAFARAIEADSGFTYAYWRYAQTNSEIDRPVEPEVMRRYMAGRATFPERDRLQIEAQMSDTLPVVVARLRELTERYREHWPGHWEYADRLTHDGSLLGYTYAETQAALERTLRLNPRLEPAWQHLFWATAADGDIATADRAFAELARLRSGQPPESGSSRQLTLLRYVLEMVRSNGTVDPALADSVAADVVWVAGTVPTAALANATLMYGYPAASVDLLSRVLRRSPPDALLRDARRGIAAAWAARGAWDSALAITAGHSDRSPDIQLTLSGYRLAAVGFWIGALGADTPRAWRATLQPASGRLLAAQRAEVAWLDGLVAVKLEDPAALSAARRALLETNARNVSALAGSLAAFERALSGDTVGAARMLVEVERGRMNRYQLYRETGDTHPYLTAVNRLTAGRWLLAAGDMAAASWLLVFNEGVPFPLPLTARANYVMAGPAYLERARMEEAAGRTAGARRLYAHFLNRYDSPSSAHQKWVREARTALTRLERGSN